ncbi:glycosyl hydrolase 108 family protein [Bradyrhizobium sp. Ai1a-2]|uniref:glycoside hydrolase family 108 protein n=1 Tax=Bradyrhizobium sp. Ai1a-2 TaxID=196490 RepID=UPI0004162393|nr:glycosyl hydrolase 108 family protein [Bradyrhizobium sp. Ai1a-2]
MTAATYDAAMTRVFADEGGYTNDPVDPGGATNWGITIKDARMYWKADATPADVKAMPKAVAADIYRKHYANPMRYDDLPAGFDYSVLDAAINSGVGRAPKWAGQALGIAATSIGAVVGPAAAAKDKVAVIQKYWSIRLSFLKGLSTFWRFGKGWTRRCTGGEAAAVKMWLTIGEKLASTDAKARLDQEAGKAKAQSKNAAAGATAAGSGPTIAAPAVDPAQFTWGGKVALGILIAFLALFVIYLIRQAIIHKQRAEAYAAA